MVTKVLTAAFDDDPVINWIVRSGDGRVGNLRRYFAAQFLFRHLPVGGAYVMSDGSGAALWDLPSTTPGRRAGLRLAWAKMRYIGWPRVHRVNRALADAESLHEDRPHYYLSNIGVDPATQGGGVGSALMRPVLELCDRVGMPAALESTKRRNIPFYERHGFSVRDEFRLPDGPSFTLMWREPR